MRKPFVAGNWKMHKTLKETEQFFNEFIPMVSSIQKVEIMIAPPFTSLECAIKLTRDTNIKIGAQNMFWETEGAYTGEISAKFLTELGCKYVIIGHSERRKYFHEKDDWVNKKLHTALVQGLTPIMCIGETFEERETGKTFTVLERQLREGLKDFSGNNIKKIVIAYEPVWAIGTGKTATPETAEEAHSFIRDYLRKNFGEEATKIRILYGGSIKPENISNLFKEPDIDGGLVGGASLSPESFSKIIKTVEELANTKSR